MGEPEEAVPPREAEPSLEDEIFGVASVVEVEEPVRQPDPLLRLRRVLTESPPNRRDVAPAAAGFGTFVFVDGVMMYAPLMHSDRPSLLPQMITLLVLAFGLGGLLVWGVGGAWRKFGIGMMSAWVALTLLSVGFLTGLTTL